MLFRSIENSDELSELGIEDCFDNDAVTVIEWNKFESFDGKVLEISISINGEDRIFDISKREGKTDNPDIADTKSDMPENDTSDCNESCEHTDIDKNADDNTIQYGDNGEAASAEIE